MAESKVKSNSVIGYAHDAAARTLTFTVGEAKCVLALAACSAEVIEGFVVNGAKQRIADRAALGRDTATGLAAPPEAKFDAMRTLVEHYNTGTTEWNLAGVAGVGLDRILLAAIGEATGKDEATVRAMVKAGAAKHSRTERAYLAILGDTERAKPIVDRLRSEAIAKAAPGIDANADLDEMMAAKSAEEAKSE